MKNKIIMSSTSALAGMAIGYMLKSKMDNQNGVMSDEDSNHFRQVLENAGQPDQVDNFEHDQLENSKMVSEGSQFGVQYYNEVRDNNEYDESDMPKLE